MPDLFERLPKYVKIKETLRKEIEIGYLKEGQQIPSELTLINRFGASKMTVIRALQELAHEGYLSRIQGKGTFVTCPMKPMPVIGVMLPYTDRGVFHVILHAIEEEALSFGYGVLLCNVCDNEEKAYSFVKQIVSTKAAGLIIAPSGNLEHANCHKDCFALLKQHAIPMVCIGKSMDGMDETLTIKSNLSDGMLDLTNVVIRRGHRRIILICKDEELITYADAIEGFNNAIAQNNIDIAEIISLSDKQSFDDLIQHLKIIINHYQPTVFMTLHDNFALHLIGVLRDISYAAAEKISVTGVNDLPYFEHAGLTTLRRPLYEKGRKAIELLHEIINHNYPQSLDLPCEVIIRSSLSIISN